MPIRRPGEALVNLFKGSQIPRSELLGKFSVPRDTMVVNPILAASELGSDAALIDAVKEAVALDVLRSNAPVDKQAYQIQQLLYQLGIKANLVGPMRPTLRVDVAPDAQYKRQLRHPKYGQTGQWDKPTDVEFINLTNTPMMDWDIAGPSHPYIQSHVQSLGELEDRLQSYVQQYPDSNLQIYQTPGGFRAFEVGEAMTPAQFQNRAQLLEVDPDYVRSTMSPFDKTLKPGFPSRISHKPREGDFVAQPIAQFGGGLPNERSRELVAVLHDRPIRQAYLGASGVNPDAMALLQDHMKTASRSFQQQLTDRFKL